MQQTKLRDKVIELISRLIRAVQIIRIYEEGHSLTKEALENLYTVLDEILLGNVEITIGIIGDEIIFEKEPLYDLSMKKKSFISHLKTIGVKKITFFRGIQRNELLEFNKILAMRRESLDQPESVKKLFYSSGIKHIAIGDIGLKKRDEHHERPEKRIDDLVKQKYQSSVNFLMETYKNLKGHQSLSVQSARQIVDGLINNLLKNSNLLLILTSMKGYDENVFEHGVNVAVFTLLQAEMVGLEQKYLIDVGMAALLHDIGQLSVPEDVSTEKGQRTQKEKSSQEEEEKRALQDIRGAKILLETEGINVLSAITAFEHNMKYDMSGYPKKLYGKELNLISMMIMISDYYDRLRKKPAYYEEGGPERAYKEMMELSGTYFHPDLLNNFFSMIGVYPPGTLVELDTKEIALVIQASMLDIKRPQVEILYDDHGEKYKEPRIVNLVEKDKKGQYKRSIVKSISPKDKVLVPEKSLSAYEDSE